MQNKESNILSSQEFIQTRGPCDSDTILLFQVDDDEFPNFQRLRYCRLKVQVWFVYCGFDMGDVVPIYLGIQQSEHGGGYMSGGWEWGVS